MVKLSRHASDEHEFYTLGQKPFEHFARALHGSEPGLFNSHVYGPDGQTQFGADHIVYRGAKGEGGLEVGQSKAYRSFTPAYLKAAAKAFLDHWETHWRAKNVCRFVLFVGCAIKSRKAHDTIIELTAQFAELGLEFAVWDANTIYDKLGGAPNVVRIHLGQEFYQRIFGEPVGPLTGLGPEIERGDYGALKVAAYVQRLNQAEDAEIKELKRRVRRGEADEALRTLEASLASPVADATGPTVRAQQLRLLAALLISRDGFERAKALLDEADGLEGDSTRLRAVLALESVGPEAALAQVPSADEASLAEVRAIAHFRLSRPQDALDELTPHLEEAEPSSEVLRLASLACLFRGDRSRAVEWARQAVTRDSDSRACRQTLGLVLFHRALSPSVEPSAGEWPQPIDQPLVMISDAAHADLEEAASIFAQLATDPSLTEHRGMVLWHFATLACMPWRRAEAEARIHELQQESAMPAPVAAWAVARGLQFDEKAAQAACKATLESDPADFETLLISVALTNARGDRAEARRQLDRGRKALEEAGHGALYAYWVGVLEVDSRRSPTEESLASHPWLRLRTALNIRAKKQRLSAISAVLADGLSTPRHPSLVMASAQFLLEGGWHKAAAQAAAFLTETIGTGEAIGLAAYALYHAGDPKAALAALDRTDAFPGGILPVDLARLRVACLAETGEFVAASQESVLLAKTTGAEVDLWRSIDFQLAVGAAPAALALYNEHADKLAKPAAGHIRLAHAVLHFAPEAAARLTRQVVAGAPDELVTAAFELASKLRLESEQRELVGRIHALGVAGAGGVEMVSLDQIAERISKQNEQLGQAVERYRNGHGPIHMLAGFRAGVLVSHLAQLLKPPVPGTRTFTLSTRYGRRFDPEIWPEGRESVKLLADLTALLTAHGLGLLDTVERAFGPIYVGPDTVSAVTQLRSDIETFQPSRVDAARRVIVAFEDGRIEDQASATQIDVFTVLWAREGGEPASTMNFTRLYELAIAELKKSEIGPIREALGTTIHEKAEGPKAPEGSTINLELGMAITLQEAGALAPLLRRYRLTLSADDIVQMRGSISEADASAELVASLNMLLARLAAGLQDGTYKVVPPHEGDDHSPVRRSLSQLMKFMTEGTPILWVDDRFLSSIDNPNFRVATTVEVIEALVSYERLTRQTAYDFRQHLREARWMFLPLTGDEITHHVRNAVTGLEFVETADLAMLRRGVAEALLERRILQWPDPKAAQKGVKGEVPFLLDSGHSVSDALAAIWGDVEIATAAAEAASEWVLRHLDVELFPLPVLAAGDSRSDYLIGLHLAQLMLIGVRLGPSKSGRERQAVYLNWIWKTVVEPSVRARPERWVSLLDMLEQHLTSDLPGIEAEDGIWIGYLGLFINALPQPLRAKLIERAKLRKVFGLPGHGQVTVDGHDFDEIDFWIAITDANANEGTEITSAAGEPAQLTLIDTDPEDRHVKLQIAGKSLRIDAWPSLVSSDDPHTRLSALEDYQDLLDLSAEQLQLLNDRLGEIASHAERVRRAMRERHASMEQWYADLESSIAQRTSFRITDLAPDQAQKVVHLLRLEGNDIEAAATRLIAERGLAMAIRRFGALPIYPPEAIQAAVTALVPGELPDLIQEIGDEGASPWLLVFLMRLLASEKMPATPEREQLVEWMITNVTEPDEKVRWDLYASLARFVASVGHTIDGWQNLSATQQLACCWLHAGIVAELVIIGQVKIEQLVSLLDDHRIAAARQLVEDLNKFRGDRADPVQTSEDQLRFFAFAPLLLNEAAELKKEDPIALALADLLLDVKDGQALVRLNLIQSGLAPNDHLGSYFSFDPAARLDPIMPDIGSLFGEGLTKLIRMLLSADPGTPSYSAGWSHLRATSGEVELPPEMESFARERLIHFETALDHGTMLEKRLVLLAITALAAANGWNDLAPRLDAAALTLVPVEDEDDEDMNLLEIAIWRARLERDSIARTKTMARELQRLAAFPGLKDRTIIAAQHFAQGLSGHETEAFVDMLAAHRASY